MSDLNVLDIEVSIENIADAKEIEAVVNEGLLRLQTTTSDGEKSIYDAVELGNQQIETATRMAKQEVKDTADEYIPQMQDLRNNTEQFMLDAQSAAEEAKSFTPSGYQELVGNVSQLSDTIATQEELGYLGGNLAFDKIADCYLNSLGGFSFGDNQFDTWIAKVESGKQYIVGTSDSSIVIGYYTSMPNKSSTTMDGTRHVESTNVITIPSGANYLTFRVPINYNKAQINEGTTLLPYTPHSKSNVDLTREAQDLEASNYLGWTTPTELIEKGVYNYVADDVCHQRVARQKINTISFVKSGKYENTFYIEGTSLLNYIRKPDAFGVLRGYTYVGTDMNTDKLQAYSKAFSLYYNSQSTTDNQPKGIYIRNTSCNTVADLQNALKDLWLYTEAETERTVTTQLSDEIATLKPSGYGYSTSGLSYGLCTYVNGGYTKIGNLAIVNLRVKATSSGSIAVDGLPKYTNVASENLVSVCAMQTDIAVKWAYISRNGQLLMSDAIADKTYLLSATYICD